MPLILVKSTSVISLSIVLKKFISDNCLQVEDSELADVAAVSAGNNYEVGNMIAEAMSRVGRKGVVTLEEGRSSDNNLYVVEGMQFDRGYISPYFVTDNEKMAAEYENCKVKASSKFHLHIILKVIQNLNSRYIDYGVHFYRCFWLTKR